MAKETYSKKLIARVNKAENFSLVDYEDAEELTKNQLIGEVNRLGYLLAVMSADLDTQVKS